MSEEPNREDTSAAPEAPVRRALRAGATHPVVRRALGAAAMLVGSAVWVPGVIVGTAFTILCIYVSFTPMHDAPIADRVRGIAFCVAILVAWVAPGVVVYRRFRPQKRTVAIGGTIGVLIGLGALAVLALQWAALGLLGFALFVGGHGRPVRAAGRAIGPPLPRRASGRVAHVPLACPPGPLGRVLLGMQWARDGAEEHASVRAFEELEVRLESLNAPGELLRRCARAAVDERRHADLAFGVAAAYVPALRLEGEPRPPSVAPTVRCREASLAELACESFEDGCLGEALAAASLGASAVGCQEPAVRAVLEELARDEQAHVELAWATIAFCLAAGGAPVRGALGQRLRAGRPSRSPAGLPHWLGAARHGRFSERDRGALAARVRGEARTRLGALVSRASD